MTDEKLLVGYVLKSIEREEQREVDAYLRTHPEALKRLDLVQRALRPLAADRQEIAPPAGLWIRTLGLVAQYRCRDLPLLPKAPPVRSAPPPRVWWRRADVLVAACLLVILLPLISPGLSYLRQQRNIIACQNNLRVFGLALTSYSDFNGGCLPKVEAFPPRNRAGIFVPILHQEGFLEPTVSVRCPASGLPSPPLVSLPMLETEYRAGDRHYEEHVRQLAGCYAYVLGYRGPDGNHFGVRRHDPNRHQADDQLPIMADRPPFDQKDGGQSLLGNSRNHEAKGQNVLHLGGNVAFYTKRDIGIGGNDIYLNIQHRPEAGLNPSDAVLGASGFKPYLQAEGP